MYRDTPSEAVNDDFEDLLFKGSSLGHNILGTPDSLDAFTSDVCREYLTNYYTPTNMVAFYSGPIGAAEVEREVRRAFGAMQAHTPVRPVSEVPDAPLFDRRRKADTHQCHIVTGIRVGGMNDTGRFANALAANVLAGPGMNSMLNMALREKRGLVYSVEASTTLFEDIGVVAIYYGCDPEDEGRCRRTVRDTIARMADSYGTPRRLERSVRQYLGQLAIASDNRENAIFAAARSVLFRGHLLPREHTAEAIRAVSADEFREAASRFMSTSTLVLGGA